MEYLINENIIKAIYLTLFHSLWLGTLIGLVVGVIIIITKKSSSAFRYNLLLGSLGLFTLCMAFIFINIIQSERFARNRQAVDIYSTTIIPGNLSNETTQNYAENIINKARTFCNVHSKTIVIFWFLIICFKCFQLMIGLIGIINLKKKQILPAGDMWEKRLKDLSLELNISQYIKIAQSGIAKVPMTIGYFKPVILLPIGLFAAIPQDQIEAILLHELAHIRRKDYLINILQSLVEMLFFFNPAILWLSSLLRMERENCCDDIAISRTINKTNYIKALIAFGEYQNMAPKYATAITGSKSHLLNRAKRLIYNHNKTLNSMEKLILMCGMVAIAILIVANTKIEKHNQYRKNASTDMVKKHKVNLDISIVRKHKISSSKLKNEFFTSDTTKVKKNFLPEKRGNIEFNGIQYKIVNRNGKITELYVNGVRIPNDKIAEYKLITDSISAENKRTKILAERAKSMVIFAKSQGEHAKKEKQYAKNLIERNNLEQSEQALKLLQELKEQARNSNHIETLLNSSNRNERKKVIPVDIEKSKITLERARKVLETLEWLKKLPMEHRDSINHGNIG